MFLCRINKNYHQILPLVLPYVSCRTNVLISLDHTQSKHLVAHILLRLPIQRITDCIDLNTEKIQSNVYD